MERVVALLCNPAAGGGRAARVLPAVEAALRELDVSFHTEVTRDLEHARALARAAAYAGEVPAALGGDGLAGCVAGVVREIPGAVLGVLPGGRGNDLARVLGIPSDLRGACRVIAAGRERALDLGVVGEQAVYLYGLLRALSAWSPARFSLRLDGEPLAFTGSSIAAANSTSYGGGMLLAPDAQLADGLLDVVTIAALSKPRFLGTMPKVLKGAHVGHPAVRVLRARELHGDADRPFDIYADGDPIGRTPTTIRVLPRAVRVLAPR